jgi:hypothetical protein
MTTTTTAALDDLEMPPPPNTAPVESALAKVERTLRKRKHPGWSENDYANFATAVRLCQDREEAIPRGLQKRFSCGCSRLAVPLMRQQRNPAWLEFGDVVRKTAPIVDASCNVCGAIKIIAEFLNSKGIRQVSVEHVRLIKNADTTVARSGSLMSKQLVENFHAAWRCLDREVRHRRDQPVLMELARSLNMPLPLAERIRDAEAAISIMAKLIARGAPDSPAELEAKIRHLDRVFRQVGIMWPYHHDNLPDELAWRFELAAHRFAIAVTERRAADWCELQRALSIDPAPDGRGYLCGPMHLFQYSEQEILI